MARLFEVLILLALVVAIIIGAIKSVPSWWLAAHGLLLVTATARPIVRFIQTVRKKRYSLTGC